MVYSSSKTDYITQEAKVNAFLKGGMINLIVKRNRKPRKVAEPVAKLTTSYFTGR